MLFMKKAKQLAAMAQDHRSLFWSNVPTAPEYCRQHFIGEHLHSHHPFCAEPQKEVGRVQFCKTHRFRAVIRFAGSKIFIESAPYLRGQLIVVRLHQKEILDPYFPCADEFPELFHIPCSHMVLLSGICRFYHLLKPF